MNDKKASYYVIFAPAPVNWICYLRRSGTEAFNTSQKLNSIVTNFLLKAISTTTLFFERVLEIKRKTNGGNYLHLTLAAEYGFNLIITLSASPNSSIFIILLTEFQS